MRKALSLTLLLLLTLSVTFFAVSLNTDSEKENVQIFEKIRYGDRSYAENIKVNFVSAYNYTLQWDTEYTIGDSNSAETEFHFSRSRTSSQTKDIGMTIYSSFGYDFLNKDNNTGLNKAYNELASTAEPYMTVKKEILISDYMDYYDFDVHISLPDIRFTTDFTETLSAEEKKIINSLRGFFKIPVLDNHRLIIDLITNYDGEICQTGTEDSTDENGDFSFYTDALATEDEFLISFSNRTTTGVIVDTSEIPGGYGVYALPFSQNNGNYNLKVDELKNVFPVDPENEIYNMYLSQDGKKLYVLIRYSEVNKAVILDTDTYAKLGEFTISESSSDYISFLKIEEDFILATVFEEEAESETYKVFTPVQENKYQEKLAVQAYITVPDKENGDQINCGTYPGSLGSAVYDGEYLYIVTDNIENDYNNMCPHTGFSIAVYGKEGLLYHGDYDTSLSAGYDGNFFSSFYVNNDYEKIIKITLPSK